jgi:hypothetical protein
MNNLTAKLSTLWCRTISILWLVILSSLAYTSHSVFAQEKEWWFDVELILYKRDIAPNAIAEHFPEQFNQASSLSFIDPLSDYLYPDLAPLYSVLPICFVEKTSKDSISFQFDEFDYSDQAVLIEDTPANSLDNTIDEETPPNASENTIEDEPSDLLPMSEDDAPDDLTEAISNASQRIFEDGSYFSDQHMALWIASIPLPEIEYPDTQLCRYPQQQVSKPFIKQVPYTISSREYPLLRNTQLLSSDSLELQELAKDIGRHRGLGRLVHMAWRQQVFFGEQNSVPMRIFAGQNFADRFDPLGNAIPVPEVIEVDVEEDQLLDELKIDVEQDQLLDEVEPLMQDNAESDIVETLEAVEIDLVEIIRAALQSDEPISEYNVNTAQTPNAADELAITDQQSTLNDLWELEGSIKVFLRYIQRTPYLHVASDIDFRAPVFEPSNKPSNNIVGADQELQVQTAARLQSYPFSQLRRVISQQIHYFDHPMFGMIIQIRRYDFPEPEQEPEPEQTGQEVQQ